MVVQSSRTHLPNLNQFVTTVSRVATLAGGGSVFAVLDACGAPSVRPRLAAQPAGSWVSLYRDTAEEGLDGIAPYLAKADPDLVRWIAETAWATPWGVFLIAAKPLDELRLHLRRFLSVRAPDGDQWYFRFYDPRVLLRFFEVATDAQAESLLGPVTAFAVTDPDTYGVRLVGRGGAALPLEPPRVRLIRR